MMVCNTTFCKIKWVDTLEEQYVFISPFEDLLDENGDSIFPFDSFVFFYGLSREDLIKGLNDKTVFENEWVVVEVID